MSAMSALPAAPRVEKVAVAASISPTSSSSSSSPVTDKAFAAAGGLAPQARATSPQTDKSVSASLQLRGAGGADAAAGTPEGKRRAAPVAIKRVTMSSKPSSSTDPTHIIDDGFQPLVGADAVLGPAVIWTDAQDDCLRQAVEDYKDCTVKSWIVVAAQCAKTMAAASSSSPSSAGGTFTPINAARCAERWNKVLKPGLTKRPWAKEEDQRLCDLVKEFGPKRWSLIANNLIGRIGKQCRERWHNHLNPEIRKDPWTPEEDKVIKTQNASRHEQ